MNYFTETGTAILTDEELRFLSESTPLTEGCGLSEFLDEASEVAKAIDAAQVSIENASARLLFLMRGFYFLGVLRGGEAYRDTLEDADGVKRMSFELSDSCADLFAEDLNNLAPHELAQLCATVGIEIA